MKRVWRLYRTVRALWLYRAFVSLLVTRSRVQISYWDGNGIVTGDVDSANLLLRTLQENRRRHVEWARIYGRTAGSRRG